MSSKRAVHVVGVGMIPFTKPGASEPYTVMGARAAQAALADAGVDYHEVQQAYVGYVYGDSTAGQAAIYGVGLSGIPVFNVNNNCSTGSTALFLARQAVMSGAADCVLALGFDNPWILMGLLGMAAFSTDFGLMSFGVIVFMLGMAVFALVWLRLLARFVAPTPKINPALPAWQNLPAQIMHLALYALMIGAPLAGWLILSAAGKPIPFFGLELPALVEKTPKLAGTIKEWHEWAGVAGYWLIGLHAVAGLFHHFISHDNTLLRILPRRA